MTLLTQKIVQLIQDNKGISLDHLTERLENSETSAIDAALKNLISAGSITFIWGKLYPNIRTIGIIPKGQRQVIMEIELKGISIDDLKAVITPYNNDPLFYDGYPIDETNKSLFERTNNIEFDFDKYDYYLLCGFDNSEDHNRG